MIKRYNICNVIHNNELGWQNDGNQDGPYIIGFVSVIAFMIEEGKFSGDEIKHMVGKPFKMGVEGTLFKKNVTTSVRREQATFLEEHNTNFSTSLFIDFKLLIFQNEQWYADYQHLKFEDRKLTEAYKRRCHVKDIKGLKIRDFKGVDAFGLQRQTQKKMIDSFEITLTSDTNANVKPEINDAPQVPEVKVQEVKIEDDEPKTVRNPRAFLLWWLGGLTVGVASALIFNIKLNSCSI